MRTVWLFCSRLYWTLYLGLGGYKAWSSLYRFIWERRFRDVKLKVFENLKSLIAFVGGGGRWRADSWRALGDAVSSPQRVQQIFAGLEPQPDSDLDCDDFMAFTVNAIEASKALGWMAQDGIANPRCLTVMWMAGWKLGGHNVTLLEHPQPEGTVLYSYMDYAGPSIQCKTVDEIVELVRLKYAAPGADEVAWCRAMPDLTPLGRGDVGRRQI